eukprot:TRINITY_DN30717_c0_g1_i1.p1 TRINITY_DN30717_c0_g1~~TRINITY_DN30717_c0_g1_i1.p1  ORF type:complete len:122 (-),score=9.49 TRINITY_DN30717_c0_g1_i1:66-431(-)
MPPPKKRFTAWFVRRKRLMMYLDHYRHLYKVRNEHFHRQRYQDQLDPKGYSSPPFRYLGFWPESFGYHKIAGLSAPEAASSDAVATSTASSADGAAPTSDGRDRISLTGGGRKSSFFGRSE